MNWMTVWFAMSIAVNAGNDESKVTVSAATDGEHEFRVHIVESPYQAGQTKINVLLPEQVEDRKKYPVLYVLPVEADDGRQWGNALKEVKSADLANRHGLICVVPTFSALPWYADHPTDKTLRQESYFIHVVLPFVERTYPAMSEARGRLLLGFSKSGWGAFSLLLRHPGKFGRAVAWDAPLMMNAPNRYGMGPIFGTQENFEQFQISALLRKNAPALRARKRLILAGHSNFQTHHEQADSLMRELGIKHDFVAAPRRRHHWESGWLPAATQRLLESE